jgi:SAM-dependent methyltransferase
MLREATTDLAMLDRLVKPAGKDIVDVGCGGGALVRALAERGARPIGLEISAEQLAPALAHDEENRARYVVGRAQELPFADGSFDGVVFMRALHHVPAADLPRAVTEARRVLRPGGMVYVVEPLAEGSYFELLSLVEDEREVRTAAQRALEDSGAFDLERVTTVEYEVRFRIADLGVLRARAVSVDPARAEVFEAREAELREAFTRLGEADEDRGGRWFLQPMRADVLLAGGA